MTQSEPTALNHAYLIKGWLLGQEVPAEVTDALAAVIESLASQNPADSLVPTKEMLAEAKAAASSIVEGADIAASQDDPAALANSPAPKVRRKAEWSMERRAEAAERMRAARAKRWGKPLETPPSDPGGTDFTGDETRITVPKPRRVSQMTDSDWPEVKRMLATCRSRAAVASDYDEEPEGLDHFIASCQRREAKELGEALAPLPPAAGAARPTW